MGRSLTRAIIRAVERDQRERAKTAARQQKVLARHQKELAKLQAKQAALNAAHAEIAQHQATLQELVSLHVESSDSIDWVQLAARLPTPPPSLLRAAEAAARRQRTLFEALGDAGSSLPDVEGTRCGEEEAHARAQHDHEQATVEHAHVSALALRVLRREPAAQGEALRELELFEPLKAHFPSVEVTAHSSALIELRVRVRAFDALPAQTPSLTASGKLSWRSTPRKELASLYEQHVASACLRIGREVLAALPAEVALIHVLAPYEDGEDAAIASVVFGRALAEALEPRDAPAGELLRRFQHRLGSPARSGGLSAVVPFVADEIVIPASARSVDELFSDAAALLADLSQGGA